MTARRQRLGTCYYPEHWPRARWPVDAALMVEAGISHVRIGEFAWSRLEPEPGRYDFDWLDDAFEVLHAAGLRVIVGTPTATPPKWLVDAMPDMVAIDAEGRPRGFGSRRHYCFSHRGYRAECARIVEALARRYGTHPALEAWQTDNEYGCHDTVVSHSAAARDEFRDWLAQKYQSVDSLNRAWGNVFWSMAYRAFDEIELPNLTVTEPNPAHVMDFRRFSSEQVVSFNRLQARIIRAHSPGRPISHNFMGSETGFDHYAVSADLDIATWDSYPIGFLDRDTADPDHKRRYLGVGDPDLQAFHHDLYRACGQVRNGDAGRWWVMEQQPGPVNWAPFNPAPEPGALRLWAFEAFAAGAEIVSYFRWRQVPFAQEQMHEGLLLPDGERNEGWHVCRQVAAELDTLAAMAVPTRAEVALVFDYESAWAWTIQPQGADFSHLDMALRFYRALRRCGASVDVVPPTAAAVAGRSLVVMPSVFAPGEALVDELARGDAQVIVGPRSGSKTPDFSIHPDLPPGPLRRLIDIAVTRVESRPPFAPVPLADGTHFEGWREFVRVGGGEVETVLKSQDGHAAHLRCGRIDYLAGRPDAALAETIVRAALARAGLAAIDLPRDVRIRDHGALRYVFNYGPEPATVPDAAMAGTVVLGANPLPPRGVMALRRDL
ncbi:MULTISPECIES: beta-galactosidase [unclassified Roseitalea]|uniref:beta-galactosidase n=1 Tax=unclassified Roseitalea TaxID=2639107 RepID=UPI00273E4A9B|nr:MULTISPECIES: beta-galactosidase [unclassified Roseitalea]